MMIYRLAIMLALICVIAAGCGGGNADSNGGQQPVVSVCTRQIEQVDFPVTIRIGGTLKGDRQTVIPAKVQTTVIKIRTRRGRMVREGQLLIMLDPGGVQSQYRQAEAVFLNAEKQHKKMQSLYDAGAVAETQLDAAETEFKVAKANFEAARRTIEIKAPFDGVVTDVYVRAGDEVAPGTPLVEVADVGALRLLLETPVSQVRRLTVGQTVRVVSPVDSGFTMTGKVYSIADAASTITRSFEVECQFPAPLKGFAPGMYVLAEIEVEKLSSALVVPNDAILYRSGKALVYVIDGDTAALVPVTTLASADGRTAVEGNLRPGQPIVVVGQKNLTPGAKVQEADL
jgi:RND family efflux transporter MFP subunit